MLALAGCAQFRRAKAPPAAPPKPAASAPRPNLEAQKRAYDLGTTHYGEERYPEARKAWSEAVKFGPGTELGRKAQANLLKVDAILKRLHELDKP